MADSDITNLPELTGNPEAGDALVIDDISEGVSSRTKHITVINLFNKVFSALGIRGSLFVNAAGNVGMGTNSPEASLDVRSLVAGAAARVAYFSNPSDDASTSLTLFLAASASPNAANNGVVLLQVIRQSDGSADFNIKVAPGGGGATITRLGINGSTGAMNVTKLGIGKSNPDFDLEVSATMSGTFYQSAAFVNASNDNNTSAEIIIGCTTNVLADEDGLLKIKGDRQADGSINMLVLVSPGSTGLPLTRLKIIGSTGAVEALGGVKTDNVVLKTKVVDIGDWDMFNNIQIGVNHGLDRATIRTIDVTIRNDSNSSTLPLNALISHLTGTVSGGVTGISASTIDLVRLTGGPFDTSSYDSTSFNRGWITIAYVA
jgi:hypothetical protein